MNIEKISPLSNTVSIYFARPAAGQTEEFLSGHLGPARGTTHTQHIEEGRIKGSGYGDDRGLYG